MSALTKAEVESWPALGPMTLDKQRVLDLIARAEKADLDSLKNASDVLQKQRDELARTLRRLLRTHVPYDADGDSAADQARLVLENYPEGS